MTDQYKTTPTPKDDNTISFSTPPSKEFLGADLYECNGSEEGLQHGTPEDAIIGWMDAQGRLWRREWIAGGGCGELMVTAFARMPLPDAESLAASLVDTLVMELGEEHSDPDGTVRGLSDDPDRERAIRDMSPAVAAILARVENYNCEPVAKHIYSAGEVLAIMRRSCPEWECDIHPTEDEA